MKITVDPRRCVGVGLCEAHAPDLFRLNDLAVAEPTHHTVPPDREDAAREAVDECPSGAVQLVARADRPLNYRPTGMIEGD